MREFKPKRGEPERFPPLNFSGAETRDEAVDVLARTLYGEARGEKVRGIEAVAAVIMNRVRRGGWWGDSVTRVCRKPWQFSCWNEGDPNRAKIEGVSDANRVFAACLRVARRAVSGMLVDPTDGATHYHAKPVWPVWARGRPACAEIGNHIFYNDIE